MKDIQYIIYYFFQNSFKKKTNFEIKKKNLTVIDKTSSRDIAKFQM